MAKSAEPVRKVARLVWVVKTTSSVPSIWPRRVVLEMVFRAIPMYMVNTRPN